jgi:hypothetical protein
MLGYKMKESGASSVKGRIRLDYRTCTKYSDGRVIIQPSFYQVGIIIIVGILLIALLGSSKDLTFVVIIGIMVYGAFQGIQILRTPSICINPHTQNIEIGRDVSIPFADVDGLIFSSQQNFSLSSSSNRPQPIKIQIDLKHRDPIVIGTMSGGNLEKRRDTIAEWLRTALNLPAPKE